MKLIDEENQNIEDLFEDEAEEVEAEEAETEDQVNDPEPEKEDEPEQEEDAREVESESEGEDSDEGKDRVMVPIAEVHKAREQRNQLSQTVNEMQAQINQMAAYIGQQNQRLESLSNPAQVEPETPDPLLDPDNFVNSLHQSFDEKINGVTNQFTQEMRKMVASNSFENARRVHGDEFVAAAIEAADRAGIGDQLAKGTSMDPVGDAVQWYRNQIALHEIGSDPNAYRERIEKQMREKIAKELQEKRDLTTVKKDVPPSLNAKTNASNAGGELGDDEDFFNEIMS